jgi:hypothetical protein
MPSHEHLHDLCSEHHHSGRQWRRRQWTGGWQLRTQHTFSRTSGLREQHPRWWLKVARTGRTPLHGVDGVKQPDPTHALTNDQGGATTRPCYAHAVQRRIFLAQPRQRPLPVASDERGLAQIAAFGPWRDLPHHTFCPGRPVKAVPPPCVPQTADCGAHVHCGTRSSCTPMAPMSESSWVLCGHGPASTPPCPHTRNSQGQAVPGYLTQAAPAPLNSIPHSHQQDSFVVDFPHTLSFVSTTPALDWHPLL